MDIQTIKYVKKPLFVDAVQVTEENFAYVAQWCQGKIRSSDGALEIAPVDAIAGTPGVNPHACYIHVRVHSPRTPRQTRAFVGDWLLYTDRGYKVYNNTAFEESFEIAEGNGTVQAVKPQV